MVYRCIARIYDPRSEVRGSLRSIYGEGYIDRKLPMTDDRGPYIRVIHRKTMVHIIYTITSFPMSNVRASRF